MAASTRRLPETIKRRLEVATAMAWEALVDAHTTHALQFLALMAGRLEFEDGLQRYLREMGIVEPMTTALRTRILVALEDIDREPDVFPRALRLQGGPPPEDESGDEGWRRFRPEALVRGVKQRQRRNDETERWSLLAIARAEEEIIATHVDNAITFAALLDPHLGLDRAVEEYIRSVSLYGSRAQAVMQRTMARLAESYLPEPVAIRPGPAE